VYNIVNISLGSGLFPYGVKRQYFGYIVAVTGGWFSLGTPVSSTTKTDRHNVTEILAFNTIRE
jgi:hypothetical protein